MCSLPRQAKRPDRPLFKILRRRGSYLSPSRLPLTVCPPLPRPGLSLVTYIGGRALMESWIPPQASLQVMWFLCGSAWNKRWHMLVSPRPDAKKQCGSHVVPRGSNNDDVDSGPNFHQNRVVPVWFNVVPTMPKCALCSQLQNPPRLTVDPLLDAGSALTKGGQVMFRPQPLHQLPSLGICALDARKPAAAAERRTQANPALLHQYCYVGWPVDQL